MFIAKTKNKGSKPQTQDDNDVMLQAEKDEEFLEKVILVYSIHCIFARY